VRSATALLAGSPAAGSTRTLGLISGCTSGARRCATAGTASAAAATEAKTRLRMNIPRLERFIFY
jgi:hypothetical protein